MTKKTEQNTPPAWLQKTLAAGFVPYIATSSHLLGSYDLAPFGVPLKTFVLDDPAHTPFFEAYLLANSLSFDEPDYKMPNWVCVDCVLAPEAILGFMAPCEMFPKNLLDAFCKDSAVDMAKLTHLPVSGQIDTFAADGSLVNFSLFSLGRKFHGFKHLSLFTKALSLEALRTRSRDKAYRVILQYDNPSMKVHGRVSQHMMIEQPMVPLHPSRDMTMIIRMKVAFDTENLDRAPRPVEPTFWMESHDKEAKIRMQKGLAVGRAYEIVPPYAVTKKDGIFIPVLEHAKAF